ncbi:protein PTST homolog 2, chloroplastic isoform X2 [Apium graveolens]|uniref:protein PTST homolog 2, chloroplastic isoform X2 n=1 Tax=Apium graveolens TaxID=4045 RepID=UPI003D7A1071
MVTKIVATHCLISHFSVPHFSFPVISFMGFRNYGETRHGVSLVLRESGGSLGFVEGKGRKIESWRCLCKGGEGIDGEVGLEAEILEFMNQSKKPDKFPTKKELIDGGRIDLVEAIIKTGGWFSLGWETDDDESDELGEFAMGDGESPDFDMVDFKERVESLQGKMTFQEDEVESTDSSQSASSSGRSLDGAAEDDSGILGILNRLEKDRNLTLGTSNGHQIKGYSENGDHFGDSRDIDKVEPAENIRGGSGSRTRRKLNNSSSNLSSNGSVYNINDERYSGKPDMWKTWSRERAGLKDREFEAAEICFNEYQIEETDGHSQNMIVSVTDSATKGLDEKSEFNHRQIQIRLQQMGRELASTLHLLRSQSKDLTGKDQESTSGDLQKLYDTWEFHENDVTNAQAKLRSIRAKLAILEGKIALSIIESQKIVEEKQRRVNCARRALQLLQSTTIIWPNSASEVLLTGSFDGWTTQRKMEKSITGIFSATLQLYPGRYEIKFIVDGAWRCDPLRPTVQNDGYENNILIVS